MLLYYLGIVPRRSIVKLGLEVSLVAQTRVVFPTWKPRDRLGSKGIDPVHTTTWSRIGLPTRNSEEPIFEDTTTRITNLGAVLTWTRSGCVLMDTIGENQ
jgi:hypothetical protein